MTHSQTAAMIPVPKSARAGSVLNGRPVQPASRGPARQRWLTTSPEPPMHRVPATVSALHRSHSASLTMPTAM